MPEFTDYLIGLPDKPPHKLTLVVGPEGMALSFYAMFKDHPEYKVEITAADAMAIVEMLSKSIVAHYSSPPNVVGYIAMIEALKKNTGGQVQHVYQEDDGEI